MVCAHVLDEMKSARKDTEVYGDMRYLGDKCVRCGGLAVRLGAALVVTVWSQAAEKPGILDEGPLFQALPVVDLTLSTRRLHQAARDARVAINERVLRLLGVDSLSSAGHEGSVTILK
jgi:hypothetical protein